MIGLESRHERLFFFLLYFAASSLLLGIGIGFKFFSEMPLERDSSFIFWSLKWVPFSLSHFHNPFIANGIWGSLEYNLAWTAFTPLLSLVLWPITAVFGAIFSYNVANLLSLSAGSFGVFLLCRIWLNRQSSAFGGALFLLSAYVWGHLLGHLNLSFVATVPLVVLLFVWRTLSRIHRPRFVLLSVLLIVFQFGVSNEILATLLFLGLLTIVAAIIMLWSQKDVRARLLTTSLELAGSVILAIVVLSPYLYYMLTNIPTGEINSSSVFSVDPLNVVIPTRLNLLLGRLFSNVSAQFSGNAAEQGAYLGLPLLFLVGYGVLTELSSPKKVKPGWVLLHVMLAVVAVLSLGRSLHILDRFHNSVWLPWRVFEKIPLLRQALPARFSLYTSLLASLAGAFSYDKIGSKATRYVAGIIILAFLLPNPSLIYRGSVEVPAFFSDGLYRKYVSKEETVLLLPAYESFGTPAFFQAYSDFHFHISQEIAGAPPVQVRKVLSLSDYTDPFKFHLYLSSLKINKILIVGNWKPPNQTVLEGLPSASIGGVTIFDLTNLDRIIQGDYAAIGAKVESLRDASIAYHRKQGSFQGLYPRKIEELGLIDSSFGGPERRSPKDDVYWSDNGYYVAPWGDSFAIGVAVADSGLASYLSRRFAGEFSGAYFPYPTAYDPAHPSGIDSFFLIFKAAVGP